MTTRIPKIPALKVFVEVMHLGTIAQVADKLHMTPSAASRMLSALESDLDLVLFHRQRQRLIPTDAAEAFLPEAMRVLSVLDELPRITGAIRDGSTRDQLIRILSFPRLAEQIMPAAINRYYAGTGSDARIDISVRARSSVTRWASSRMFDVALTSVPVVHSDVTGELITDFPLCVTLPKDHALAQEAEVPIEALAEEPLSLIQSESILCKRIDRVFDQAGLTPNVRQRSDTLDVAVRIGLASGSLSINDGIFSKTMLGSSHVLRRIKTDQTVPVGFVIPLDRKIEGAAAAIKDAIRTEVLAYRAELDKVLDPVPRSSPA